MLVSEYTWESLLQGGPKFKMPGTTESSEWLAKLGTTMSMKYHQLMGVAQTGQWTGQLWEYTAPPVVHQLTNILPTAQSQSLSSDASDESFTDSEELPTVEINLPGRRIRPPIPPSSEWSCCRTCAQETHHQGHCRGTTKSLWWAYP